MEATESMKVAKTDVALRQLFTAVDLYFDDGDPVSIHTLTAAAHGLLEDLATKSGQKTPMYNTLIENLPKELVDVVRKAARSPQNFFKHADRDADAVLEFSPKLTELLLLDAMLTFAKLAGEIPWKFEAFTKWFALQNPTWFENVEPWPKILKVAPQFVDLSNRPAYFRDYRQSVERSR